MTDWDLEKDNTITLSNNSTIKMMPIGKTTKGRQSEYVLGLDLSKSGMKEVFETCWDDDHADMLDWISEQLRQNPDKLFRCTVELEEIDCEEE